VEKHVIPTNVRTTVKLWGPPPQYAKLVARHPLNKRRLDQTVANYVRGILQHGVLAEMRGMIVLVEVSGSKNQYLAVGGGTLIESCYQAHDEEPMNVNVCRLKEDGLDNCMIFNVDFRDADISWVKRVHNRFHDGQGNTIAEMCPKES
jgi:hypothetical protein